MSYHFSANQYESAFSPQRLQSYEVPRRHKQRPSLRPGKTQIIANSRGHLNSDVPRSPASPWGSFVGTWQAERRPIQLKTRTKFSAHLSRIDQGLGEGGDSGSKKSSRAASAVVVRGSVEPRPDSLRPSSALESRQGANDTQEVSDTIASGKLSTTDNKTPTSGDSERKTLTSTRPTSETNGKSQTPASVEAKSPSTTPAPEKISAPPTTSGSSHPPAPPPVEGNNSKPSTPLPGTPVVAVHSSRAASAASSRSSATVQSCSSLSRTNPSRVQSATTYSRGTPVRELLHTTTQSRLSTAATVSSRGEESTHSPLPSTRIPSPLTPA